MKCLLILAITCHLATAFNPRISGGPEADIRRFPYMVSLSMRYGNIFFCSGSLIHVHWTLTAAHCERDPKLIAIRVGSSYVAHEGDVYIVSKFISEPHYKAVKKITNRYDIGLVKTNEAVRRSPTIQLLRLPKSDDYFKVGSGCMVAGFGKTMVPRLDAQERRLRNLGMPILATYECAFMPRFFAESMLCSGFLKTKAGVCSGDSGAPLVCNGVVYGTVSMGHAACENTPAAFVNVVKFTDWIEDVIREE